MKCVLPCLVRWACRPGTWDFVMLLWSAQYKIFFSLLDSVHFTQRGQRGVAPADCWNCLSGWNWDTEGLMEYNGKGLFLGHGWFTSLSLLCRYEIFLSCLIAALVSPKQNNFPHRTLFHFMFPIAQRTWANGQAVVPGRLSLNKCLWNYCTLKGSIITRWPMNRVIFPQVPTGGLL